MVDHSEGKLQGGRQRQHLNCTLEEGSRLGKDTEAGSCEVWGRGLGGARFGSCGGGNLSIKRIKAGK